MILRLFELILCVICLVLGIIPMGFIALLILLIDGLPVFFCQTRIGRAMRPFRLYKFRTMKSFSKGDNILTVGKDLRTTKLGYWLRKYYLDETPQLFNILSGDMSFIGPRPEVPEFVDTKDPIQQQVLSVRPGLFDSAALYWLNEAQLLGQVDDWREYYRQMILPDKLNRSLDYLKTKSIKNDIKLLCKAIGMIMLRRA